MKFRNKGGSEQNIFIERKSLCPETDRRGPERVANNFYRARPQNEEGLGWENMGTDKVGIRWDRAVGSQ